MNNNGCSLSRIRSTVSSVSVSYLFKIFAQRWFECSVIWSMSSINTRRIYWSLKMNSWPWWIDSPMTRWSISISKNIWSIRKWSIFSFVTCLRVVLVSPSIDDFCKAKKLAKNGSKLVDMIDNLLSRIIELRAAVNDSETAALDLQMHCVRSLMVSAFDLPVPVLPCRFTQTGILWETWPFTYVH